MIMSSLLGILTFVCCPDKLLVKNFLSLIDSFNLEWKKDMLQVSHQILKDCWRYYQSTVKEARREYLSNLIESNCHNPCVI